MAARKIEDDRMACKTCRDRNVSDRSHACCDQRCKGITDALQAFPFAAWGGVSGAKLAPEEVVKARKVDVGNAERKPVWATFSRHVAKVKGWK